MALCPPPTGWIRDPLSQLHWHPHPRLPLWPNPLLCAQVVFSLTSLDTPSSSSEWVGAKPRSTLGSTRALSDYTPQGAPLPTVEERPLSLVLAERRQGC